MKTIRRSYKFIEYHNDGYFNTKYITFKIIDKYGLDHRDKMYITIGYWPDFKEVI